MITSQTRIVDEQGRPTRELVKALPMALLPSVQVVDGNGFPTDFFRRYAAANGVALSDDEAIATITGLATRELLNSGLLS